MDRVEQRPRRRHAEDARQLQRLLGARQRGQLEPLPRGRARELGDQPAQDAGLGDLVVAVRGHDGDPGRRETAGEDRQHLSGGGVRPVEVLHDHEHRPTPREALEQGHERHPEPGLAGRRQSRLCPTDPEIRHEPRELVTGGTRQLKQLTDVDPPEQGLQHRHEGCVRKAVLTQLDAVAPQHMEVVVLGGEGRLGDQPALADAGAARDEHRRPPTGRRVAQRAAEDVLLGVPADEAGARDPRAFRRHHDRSIQHRRVARRRSRDRPRDRPRGR